MKNLLFAFFIIYSFLISSQIRAEETEDSRVLVLTAMKEELIRSKENLEIKNFEKPYFISYLLQDSQKLIIAAKYGATIINNLINSRSAYVDLRVGSYEFDDSCPTYQLGWPSGPLEDNYEAIKAMFWQITDKEYKNSINAYLRKRGKLVTQVEKKDRPDDFSKEAIYRFIGPRIDIDFQQEQWKERLNEVSNIFKDYPWLDDSGVSFCIIKGRKYFVSTEGSEYITENLLLTLSISASTIAPEDGMPLENSIVYNVCCLQDLPTQETILQQTKEMLSDLKALRQAEILLPYTGPAILDPSATSVLFHEAIGHRLEGDRQKNDDEGQTFKDKVGEMIIPEFITVIDDPTLDKYNQRSLSGHYIYDEQGIPGQRVVLIENGILKNYLMSRSPVKGFNKSNGHGRSDGRNAPISRMGNFFVTSEIKLSYEELKKRLIEECKKTGKPYGLIIKNIRHGFTNTQNYDSQMFCESPTLVYKVDLDTGTETLVRGVDIVGTPLSTINKVIATGDDDSLFNGFCSAESGTIPQTEVAPSSLSTEIELQKSTSQNRRPAILLPPFEGIISN